SHSRAPPLRAAARTPDRSELAALKRHGRQTEPLVKISLILRFELVGSHSRTPPLRATAGTPDSSVLPILDVHVFQTQALVKIGLILRLEFVGGHSGSPPLRTATRPPYTGVCSLSARVSCASCKAQDDDDGCKQPARLSR